MVPDRVDRGRYPPGPDESRGAEMPEKGRRGERRSAFRSTGGGLKVRACGYMPTGMRNYTWGTSASRSVFGISLAYALACPPAPPRVVVRSLRRPPTCDGECTEECP